VAELTWTFSYLGGGSDCTLTKITYMTTTWGFLITTHHIQPMVKYEMWFLIVLKIYWFFDRQIMVARTVRPMYRCYTHSQLSTPFAHKQVITSGTLYQVNT